MIASMRARTWLSMLLVAAGAMTACKQKAPADAAPRVAAPDAAAAGGALALPADARTFTTTAYSATDGKVDATALGAAVTAQLLTRAGPHPDGGFRDLQPVLVLSGEGAVVVELTELMWKDDEQVAEGTLEAAPPRVPPAPAPKEDDPEEAVPFAGPLLFLHERQGSVFLYRTAVAQDGDALVVWEYELVDGETDGWGERVRVQLAPGAKVTAK